MKRQYTLAKRAESQAATRPRIVEATVALHQELGPAGTLIAEVARRARVQRQTVYTHFRADAELFAACSAHWRSLHPMPDPERWERIADPTERLRLGLREVYAWYRETRSMTAHVLRDAQIMPALNQVVADGLLNNLDRLADLLVQPLTLRGKQAARARIAARAAIDFRFWELLQPFDNSEAADLGAGFVELAAVSWASEPGRDTA